MIPALYGFCVLRRRPRGLAHHQLRRHHDLRRMAVLAVGDPFQQHLRSALRPISVSGWRTVVSDGV